MIENSTSPRRRPKPEGGIRLKDLNVSAGKRELLHDVDAEFHAGQITLIVGPSGVGKSVLLKLIAGIRHPILWFQSHWNMLAKNGVIEDNQP